jgi:hypothetical protein
MNTEMRVALSWLVIALFITFTPIVMAETSPATMPPAAREAFDKGMAAVDQQEWLVAVSHFEKAATMVKFNAGERAPQVLFNLGLAESRVSGRELRALAWFKAYLAEAPDAPNSPAVRKECASLEVKMEATLQKLVAQAKQLAAQLQGRAKSGWIRRPIANIMIAGAQARMWDFTGAIQTAKLVLPTPEEANPPGILPAPFEEVQARYRKPQRDLWACIELEQARTGDFDGAKSTLQLAPEWDWNYANLGGKYEQEARRKAEVGDFTAAEMITSLLPRESQFKTKALQEIDRIKKDGKQHTKATRSEIFYVNLFKPKSTGMAWDPSLSDEVFTDLPGTLKTVAAGQTPVAIAEGYIRTVEKLALMLRILRWWDDKATANMDLACFSSIYTDGSVMQ